jgi:hypothetical protein
MIFIDFNVLKVFRIACDSRGVSFDNLIYVSTRHSEIMKAY